MTISNLSQSFILHLGEMGSRWGINRTVGQIYAFMFLVNKPVCADELVEKLNFSRSNISTSIKELLSWRLIKLTHLQNDRRDFYVTPNDVWAIFKILLEERKKREIDPTLSFLRDLVINQNDNNENKQIQERMQSMLEVVEAASFITDTVSSMQTDEIMKMINIFHKMQKVLKLKRKIL
jgi:DNA-binding transcriptional regulator GbsR (MarR family)